MSGTLRVKVDIDTDADRFAVWKAGHGWIEVDLKPAFAAPDSAPAGLSVERLAAALLVAQENGDHNANCLSTDCPVAWEMLEFAPRVLAALAADATDD